MCLKKKERSATICLSQVGFTIRESYTRDVMQPEKQKTELSHGNFREAACFKVILMPYDHIR